MDYSKQYDYKGACPICDRDMYDDGKSINRHHFIPKSRGGKEQFFTHTLCHNMIHSLWTEKQLEMEYSDATIIKEHPEMQTFIAWVKKKDPLFYIKTKDSNSRKVKRKGK
jgi:hypothetical protein